MTQMWESMTREQLRDEAVRQARIGNGAMIEADQLREALEQIRLVAGKVCDSYETCDHPACQSSYAAWAIADKALQRPISGVTEP